jgi:hypothetical protein
MSLFCVNKWDKANLFLAFKGNKIFLLYIKKKTKLSLGNDIFTVNTIVRYNKKQNVEYNP